MMKGNRTPRNRKQLDAMARGRIKRKRDIAAMSTQTGASSPAAFLPAVEYVDDYRYVDEEPEKNLIVRELNNGIVYGQNLGCRVTPFREVTMLVEAACRRVLGV